MIPPNELFQYALDAVVLAGLISRLAGRNAEQNGDDELVAHAHEYLLNVVGDADWLAKIAAATGVDPRQQLTIEQVQAIEEEARLRRMGASRN